ncbi:MAG: sigma-70 family RNA polymerase sigma factor [Acidobacteriota bacterium]
MSSKPDSDSLRQFLLAHLDTVERLVSIIARRHNLSASEREELLGEVNLKLVENDYEALRRFSGRGSIESYLAMVITNLLHDARVKKWGKWRPSAKARRLGVVATQLDILISRDGHPVEEAVELLRRNHHVAMSRNELRELAAQLPRHPSRYFARDVDFDRMVGRDGDDTAAAAEDEERERVAERVEGSLQRALKALASDERFLIRMVFRDDVGVTEVARLLGSRRQPLYRRVYGVLKRLRRSLEEMGVGLTDVVEVVGWDGRMIDIDFDDDDDDDDDDD